MAPTCGSCADCGRGIIQQRTWCNASPEERAEWTDAGQRPLQGRGLCGTCYQRAYKRRLRRGEAAASDITASVPCCRCGLPAIDGLCGDCIEVVAELNESDRWVA